MKIRLFVQMTFLALFLFVSVTFASKRISNSENIDIEIGNENAVVVNKYSNNVLPNDYEYLRPVPKLQFDNAFRISMTIIFIFELMKSEKQFFKLLSIFFMSTIPIQLQYYFGYYLKLKVSLFPLSFEKMEYKHGGHFVAFDRWLLAPLFWITESILLLSDDDFKKLQLHLPERDVMIFVFLIQALHYCGIIDSISEYFTAPNFDRIK